MSKSLNDLCGKMCANFESLEEREIPETGNIPVTCDNRCNNDQELTLHLREYWET